MKITDYLKLFSCMLLFGLMSTSCQKDERIAIEEQSTEGYLGLAKTWYESNAKLASKKRTDLRLSGLTADWANHRFTINAAGDSVITIPLRSTRDTFYREIGLVKSSDGVPFGIIKEYLGDPFKHNTVLNIYTGSGRLLESALYNAEDKNMQYIKKKGQGVLSWIKKKIACNGCSGNMNDGFEIEEVVVNGYRDNDNYNNTWNNYDPWKGWTLPEIPGYPGDDGGGGNRSGSSSSSAPSSAQIKAKLKDKPFALFGNLDCDIIKKWLTTAKHQVQQAQIDKLNQITSRSPIGLVRDRAHVQDINDAYSQVVNMDYFPITINQMPIVNGKRMTPQEFLHNIRTDINSFVNTSYSEFAPYVGYGIDDRSLWKSSNPLNAVVAIDIKMTDNGSVIVSDFSNNGWTFSTIYDPKYGTHPVSGNRDFGYTQNSNGSYTFYTRGVDRISLKYLSNINSIANVLDPESSPLRQADKLWESFQKGIATFVNNHQGKAEIVSSEKRRPKWQHIKDVIDGKKPLSTLSTDCKD